MITRAEIVPIGVETQTVTGSLDTGQQCIVIDDGYRKKHFVSIISAGQFPDLSFYTAYAGCLISEIYTCGVRVEGQLTHINIRVESGQLKNTKKHQY